MRSRFLPAAIVVLVAVTTFFVADASAQWVPNGTGYGMAANDQLHPALCSDGAGGAFIVWSDSRPGPYDFDIYLQHVSGVGIAQWTANGVVVCGATGDQVLPKVVADGAGGAIVGWEDFRAGNGDVYVQAVDSMGVIKWTPNGVALCTQIDTQGSLQLAADGTGGAIAVWEDFRGLAADIYGQRVNSLGIPRWTANGRALISADEDQFTPQVLSNGTQGVIITWHDDRNLEFDIFAQKVDTTGAGVWTANGVTVCTAPGTKLNPVIATDGAGGAVIAWEDFRDDILSFDIYAQRVASNGSRLWTVNGVSLVEDDGDQLAPSICSDGSGGAIVAWQDNRATLPDIYARRINSSGVPQWAADGIAVSSANGTQQIPRAIADGAGGTIIAWEDLRTSVFNTDLYAQRVDGSGAALWTPNGMAFTTAAADQANPVIVSDGLGGLVAAWEDGRNGMSSDVFAQRLNSAGIVPTTDVQMPRPRPRGFELIGIQPNPCWSRTEIRLVLPAAQPVTAEVFDLNGRRVRALVNGTVLTPGAQSITWDTRDQNDALVGGGLYWLRVSTPHGVASGKVTVLR
jgi:hypothetical protein